MSSSNMERICPERCLPNLLQNLWPAWQGITEILVLPVGPGSWPVPEYGVQFPARLSSHCLNTSSNMKILFFLFPAGFFLSFLLFFLSFFFFFTVCYGLFPGQVQSLFFSVFLPLSSPQPAARGILLKPQIMRMSLLCLKLGNGFCFPSNKNNIFACTESLLFCVGFLYL